ncbi:MAG: L,D-transpeptidase [Hyphomicrobiales bacterium]|nr:L,D-transpeptidase [Hyphomicrobiales bacterium]
MSRILVLGASAALALSLSAVAATPARASFWDVFAERPTPPRAETAPRPVRKRAARSAPTIVQHDDTAAIRQVKADLRETTPNLLPSASEQPVTIVVSTDRQRLTVYDGDRPVAETMVSTGIPGHSTPHGVFSVIEKQIWHRSTIYSGAPMPFMQRLTWSGVALHEGHVTGQPASHGCVRLPAAFARELFRYTRRGARVVITREDTAPTPIDSVALFTAPAIHRYVMGEAVNARGMPGEIEAPDQSIGAARTSAKKDLAGAAPVTALISRKTGMLYVRRDFAPIFQSPVTIDDPDRPIGAHVYVARAASEGKAQWSTVSVAGQVREAMNAAYPGKATRSDEAPLGARATATEALNRVHLAPGVEARLSRLLSQGATLIISDDTARLRESQSGTNFVAIVD